MTLQTAVAAKTASDAAAIQTRAVLSSLTMTIIDNKITTESTRTDLDERTYKTTLDFDADVNGKVSPVEIIQSDDSKILIEDLIKELIDKGYSVSYKAIKTRDGKNDKVKLQIAWNTV